MIIMVDKSRRLLLLVAPQPPLPPSVVTTVPHHHHSSSPCCGGGESSSLEMPMMDLRGPVQPGGGVWGWIKSNEFLHKVAEKAKNSVDTMITTLDPGMKEHLYSGGDICLLVASEDEMEVSAAREAFQQVFGLATVQGCPLPPVTGAPAQSVGFSVCMKAVEERLTTLRQSIGEEQAALLAMESLLMEITPDRWFEMSCLMLEDSSRGISLHTYTQPTPVDGEFIARAREQTPSDYPLAWLGLGVPISCIIGSALGVPQSDWHRALSGVSRRETLLSASRTLATLYKSRLH
ncbi:PRRC1 [Cordylochernes scorpioides]|uniref:PRRC1 n=1 Tax=Cordylochernes scorpioides TaxID=51811 RepID=A0ABY6KEQ0_9ARAC|nr:PRRC1 [Cordylochernes scorpioides]